MVKYHVIMVDKPDSENKFSGVLQAIRYCKREEYMTMEYREVPEKDNIDITKKPEVEIHEIAVSNEELIGIRDFLNSLELD